MNQVWKQWLIGAANAILSALTSGGISFGVGVTWKKALLIAGGSAIVSLGKWIAQHPLPGTPPEAPHA